MLLKVQNKNYIHSRQTQNWYLFRLELCCLLYDLEMTSRCNDVIPDVITPCLILAPFNQKGREIFPSNSTPLHISPPLSSHVLMTNCR